MAAVLSLLTGSVAVVFYLINTLFWVLPILVISIIKLIPLRPLRVLCSHLLDACASAWISVNGVVENALHPVNIHVANDGDLTVDDWYMVLANHQSWVDILVLQRIFNRKIPFLKFFLKQELIFVPILGVAWWALDFPFMRRYSTAQLRKNPKLKGKDIEITRKACLKFKTKPVSIMNFVEGTRYQADKHSKQNSPFQNLLRPKAGGLAFALSAMEDHISKLVDVTIYYPGKPPSYWQYISGQCKEVYVDIKVTDISKSMRGDYINDKPFKQAFQIELNQIWQQKDAVYSQLEQRAKGSSSQC